MQILSAYQGRIQNFWIGGPKRATEHSNRAEGEYDEYS